MVCRCDFDSNGEGGVVEIVGNVNRKGPFCITGQQRFRIFLAIRLNKSKDT